MSSQKTAVSLVDQVNVAHAWQLEEMKERVETMLSTGRNSREKSSMASAGASGFSMYGDNVGKVINPRYGF